MRQIRLDQVRQVRLELDQVSQIRLELDWIKQIRLDQVDQIGQIDEIRLD